jgi:hypothetical protein
MVDKSIRLLLWGFKHTKPHNKIISDHYYRPQKEVHQFMFTINKKI